MFREYKCKCCTENYICLCSNSFNLFRYCKNYQKIVDSCPNLLYIMHLYFPSIIPTKYNIEFAKDISLNSVTGSLNEFIEIFALLIIFIENHSGYTKNV